MNEHRSSSFKKNTKLYAALRKYGWNNFDVEVIYQSLEHEYCLKIMEPYFIKEYDSFNTGYNLTLGGEGSIGIIPNLETRLKMSLARKGKPSPKKNKLLDEGTRKRISDGHKGLKASQEHKNNISQGLKNQLRVVCTHCGKIGAIGNMKRYHFNKCKSI
jgi:group I intron endonuclease